MKITQQNDYHRTQELLQQIYSFGPNWDYFQTKLHFYLLVSIYPVFLFLPKMTSCLAGIFRWKQQWTGLWHFLGLTSRTLLKSSLSRVKAQSATLRDLWTPQSNFHVFLDKQANKTTTKPKSSGLGDCILSSPVLGACNSWMYNESIYFLGKCRGNIWYITYI